MSELRAFNVTGISRLSRDETTRTVIVGSATDAVNHALTYWEGFDHITLVAPVKGTEELVGADSSEHITIEEAIAQVLAVWDDE